MTSEKLVGAVDKMNFHGAAIFTATSVNGKEAPRKLFNGAKLLIFRMLKIILIAAGAFLLLIAIFLAGVSTLPSTFRYVQSGRIKAPPEKIFPYLASLKLGNEWSPWTKKDPNMKITYSGPDSGVGARMSFEGNNDVGSGELEILKVDLNSEVEIRLLMTKPMKADNLIQYRLTSEVGDTRFDWVMAGNSNLLSKSISVFIDIEKMVGKDFKTGIENLTKLVESKPL